MLHDNLANEAPSLTIVVPCYNESEAFIFCLTELLSLLNSLIEKKKITASSGLLFVDDGSKDDTWSQIEGASITYHQVRGIKLSRNKGHQIALLAGLSVVDTDVCVSIDADLQDDISCIEQMLDKYMEGNEIVYGVRNNRDSDTVFKRKTAEIFYGMMHKLGVEQVANHADYRLLSRRALRAFLLYSERNIYLRGLVPLMGFQSTCVYYSRSERIAGESKYPVRKMLALAFEGVTSLSVTPLRIVTLLGFSISLVAFILILYSVINYFLNNTISGWASVIITISFLGGVQLLCLGILGEYIGKIYLETKQRPKFFIERDTKDKVGFLQKIKNS